MSSAGQTMEKYFEELERKTEELYKIAKDARSLGKDPELEPEIPRAGDLASRVEKLVGPEGVAEIIRELERQMPREEVALKVAEMIVDGKFGKFDEQTVAQQAVRTALSVLTEGVVVAPIEGITEVRIKNNFDGTQYLALYFASPIRAAGGTAAALAVLAGDFVRRRLYLSPYKATDREIERFVEEVEIYRTSVGREQYTPPPEDIRLAMQNIPVEITGDPSGREATVMAFRDLERIGHNMVRGGAVLAMVEGVMQKAPKIMKYVNKLNIDGWSWLSDIIAKAPSKEEAGPVFPKGEKYLEEVIAGRPVFSHPGTEGHKGREGGFRLRYGRARNTGIAAVGIHPATMAICDDFLVAGTQLKTERPGKGGAVTPVDSIKGPTVKLKDGSVVQIKTVEQALELRQQVDEILFLGDILIGFGEFLENNHPLMPAGYCEEWWAQEVERALKSKNFSQDLTPYLSKPYPSPPPALAIKISEELGVPLHPAYTYCYSELKVEELQELCSWLVSGEPTFVAGELKQLRIAMNQAAKRGLEEMGVPHLVSGDQVVIEEHALPLCRSLGLLDGQSLNKEKLEKTLRQSKYKDTMEIVCALAGFKIRDEGPTRIGARMGRPEKADPRRMKPSVHMLFPVGLRGGMTRSLVKAAEKAGETYVDLATLKCTSCGEIGFTRKCQKCGSIAEYVRSCSKCKRIVQGETCPTCKTRAEYFVRRPIDLKSMLEAAAENLREKPPELIKGVIGMMSEFKIPEPIEKGILRAKHEVEVFKDGTIRFDATDVPLTHFMPREIGTSVERLIELGYTEDKDGVRLERDDQVVELKVQDILLSKTGANYLLRAAKFIDDLLQKFYGLKPYYNANQPSDLVGHLVIGLAPHTSVGVVARIIGFTEATVGYAHPFFHAAKRRDCFAPDETLPIFDGKEWKIVKIGEFVEELLKNNRVEKTEFGDLVVWTNEYKTLSLNENYEYVLKPIVAFSKHPVQDHVVKVVTKDGRELTTSGLHSFLDEEQRKIPAFQATQVISPAKFSIPEKDVEQIDLLEFADESTMVVGAKGPLEKYLTIHGLKYTAERLGIPKATLFDYYLRDSVPLSILLRLGVKIPAEVRLGSKYDTVFLPRWIKVSEDFLRLLGLYVAVGHSRRLTRFLYQVIFAVTRGFDEVERAITRVFGVNPSRGKQSIAISSRFVYNLFRRFSVDQGTGEKRVPSFIFSLPLEKVKYFLQGYFEGDGGISKGSTLEINCTSDSKMLLRDIEFLLTRFGLVSGWSRVGRRNCAGKVAEFCKKKGRTFEQDCFSLRVHGQTAMEFCEKIGFWWRGNKEKAERMPKDHEFGLKKYKQRGSVVVSPVERVEIKRSSQALYNFTVVGTHNAVVSGCSVKQCDGDEDCVMLLLDALLNFSKRFLPSKRGGTMDAPLILSTRINPTEIDKEAHNMDVEDRYPLEFYEATLRYANPSELTKIIETVECRLGTEAQYTGLNFSFDTSDIAAGAHSSRYKTLETMEEKTDSQLNLAKKIRAVDARDVAERLIEHHFIPDLKGNIRTFASQSFRCMGCNQIYRRVPLSGTCARCGGKLVLTVTRGGVEKYMQIAMRIAEDYGVSEYTKQRLELTRRDIRSTFESDARRQMSLADFM